MTRLFDVTDELRDVNAALARLEKVVGENPEEEVLLLDVGSLTKRKIKLEEEFRELAHSVGLDAFRYRLIPNNAGSVALRAMTKALDRFQEAITTFYDARINGPKMRSRFSAEIRELSSFDFAYSYAGSLGLVLTMPRERVLFDSDLDQSVADFFSATQATSRDEVMVFAHQYGAPAVRRLYEWSAVHADFDLSVDINWLRGREAMKRVEAAPDALRRLKGIIEETSEETEERLTIAGMLHGLDDDDRTFHLTVLTGDIKGEWARQFSYSPAFALSQIYEADLIKRTKVHYSIDREETRWYLVALRKQDGPSSS